MPNLFLIVGALLSAVAAAMHVGCIVFGAPWYRFLGAGERMARQAAAGSKVPGAITAAIALVLALWSLYALSGAGVIPRLPLVQVALCGMTGVYLLRGVAGLGLAIAAPGERSVAFWCWSSVICLGMGVVHLIGTWQVWAALSPAADVLRAGAAGGNAGV